MSKYRTREEYQAIVKTMPAQELSSLLDTFWSSTTLTEGEQPFVMYLMLKWNAVSWPGKLQKYELRT
jgi:hypothetical protein